MDKFMELEKRIEEVINEIDNQASAKQKRIEQISKEITFNENYLQELKENIQKIEENIFTLNEINRHGIIVSLIKKNLRECQRELEQANKIHKIYMILLIIVSLLLALVSLTFFTIASPLITAIVIAIYAITFSIINFKEIKALRKLKKESSPAGLWNERLTTLESIDIRKKENHRLTKEIDDLNADIEHLMAKREEYENDLLNVTEKREEAISQLTTPLLNEAFQKFNPEDIMKRVKIRGQI